MNEVLSTTKYLIILLAFLLDILFGDPINFWHPIRFIGKMITKVESFLYPRMKNNLKLAGIILLLLISLGTYFTVWLILFLFFQINFYLGIIFEIYIIYTALAFRSLTLEGKNIRQALEKKDLFLAKTKVGNIVSRDMKKENEQGIIRATIESLTENLTDGIISPLFFAILGGAPLAMTYKAINTLDSMVGYRNERYLYFGWASAKFDDLVNFIPARLTGILLVISAIITKKHPLLALKAWYQDAQKGPSPNGGIPIVTFAGALDIKLGGNCFSKEGKIIEIPTVGGKREKLINKDITWANIFIIISTILTLFFYGLLLIF